MASLPLQLGASIFGNLLSGILGNNAAHTAADQQTQSAQQALDFQKQIWGDQQKNQAPFLEAGQQSIGQLMMGLGNGTFGPGSNPTFAAPTLEQARNTPGYQFTQQQGTAGILKGAAAAGGAISGGTLKSLDRFNTGLADSTYNDVFNRSLATYQTALQKQGQEFGQLFAPAQLGEGATQNLNSQGSQTAFNVGNLMTQIGNSQAAGTVGGANAWSNAISGGINGVTQALLFQKLFGPGANVLPGAGPQTPTKAFTPPPEVPRPPIPDFGAPPTLPFQWGQPPPETLDPMGLFKGTLPKTPGDPRLGPG